MEILSLLQDNLHFVRDFYDTAAKPFEDIQGKIEKAEEPFKEVDPEGGESPYQAKWSWCQQSRQVLGYFCLCFVQSALRLYLDSFIGRVRYAYPSLDFATLQEYKAPKANWFEVRRKYFLEELKIDWRNAPLDMSLLEELNLTRNDIQHPGDIEITQIRQSEKTFGRFPDSIFANDYEKAVFFDPEHPDNPYRLGPWRIEVSREKLSIAIDVVERFCSYIERVWEEWPPKAGSRAP